MGKAVEKCASFLRLDLRDKTETKTNFSGSPKSSACLVTWSPTVYLQREVQDCQSGEPAMNRNDELQWLILGFGLWWPDDHLGRRTNTSELWKEAKRQHFDLRQK